MEDSRWKTLLHSARHWRSFPLVVGLLAIISSGTGFYPFLPVLVVAVAFAPARWGAIYLAAVVGSATGAGLLAGAIQVLGDDLVAAGLVRMGTPPGWLETRELIGSYGNYAMAIIAALPVPQMPMLIALALAKTSPWLIAGAVLAGKAAKYGIYILGVEGIIGAIRRGRRSTHADAPDAKRPE